MRVQRSPRYQGKISSWNDGQGFGFIAPNGDGPAVFVHIKSFGTRRIRPAGGEIVTYHLTMNEKGLPRAENVAFVNDRTSRQPSAPARARSMAVAACFLGFVAASVFVGKLPVLVVGLYLGLSVVAFIAYAIDKSAARNHQPRISESKLHMLGLIGGWPGAVLAQQVLRHKSKKESFRVSFWWTVAANCGALGLLASPWGSRALVFLGAG